jgi:hypothetical protein
MVKNRFLVNRTAEFIFMIGVGGNLVAIQASRLSTALHQQGKPGEFINYEQYYAATTCPNPYQVFCSKSINIQSFYIFENFS